jgi:hypothetical protein
MTHRSPGTGSVAAVGVAGDALKYVRAMAFAPVVQLAERQTLNLRVCGFEPRQVYKLAPVETLASQVAFTHHNAGSIPARSTFSKLKPRETKMSESNILEEAGKLIEQGWCTRRLVKDGKFCSSGAIAVTEFDVNEEKLDPESDSYDVDYEVAVYQLLEHSKGVKALAEEIESSTGSPRGYSDFAYVYVWNDIQTDQQEVVNMFKSASKRL